MQKQIDAAINQMIRIGSLFYDKNWFLGTSGNLSCRLSRGRYNYIITASGVDKKALTPRGFVIVNSDSRTKNKTQRTSKSNPSNEAPLHEEIYRETCAGGIIHVHSVPALLIADVYFKNGVFDFEGFEIQKGLSHGSINKKVRIPIIENDADMKRLSRAMANVIKDETIAVLIRRHGLFCWGESIIDARRHVELLHHMFEYAIGKYRILPPAPI